MTRETPRERSPQRAAAADAELAVRVNGEEERLPAGASVADLVRLLGMQSRRLAVAVNRHVVPRARYTTTALADGDRVEILEAVGGG